MAGPSVSNTFANSTTADATQVNTNFTDLINGATDGTKDYSISALTCAGAVTLNGHVTLGNASADDLTISASLASSIPIKTTNSFDIGAATLGLRSLYLADAGSAARSTRVIGATVASSYTLTLPTGAGTAGNQTVNLGSGSLAFLPPATSTIMNYSLAASVGTSALTVALKGADGNDPSATNPIYINFRSATAATGTPVLRTVTAATSVVASSGSTLGSVSANANWVYVYAIDNAGTVELAISGSFLGDEGSVVTTTAEGGAGAADSKYVLYSTTVRASVPMRLLGRVKSTQATAGTWATSPSEVSLVPFYLSAPFSEVIVDSGNGHGSGSTKIRRFTNTRLNVGTSITYADNSTTGGAFTINDDGVYAVNWNDKIGSGSAQLAITVNDSVVTTNASTPLTYAQGLRSYSTAGGSGEIGHVSWTGALYAGDILRAHSNGANDSTDAACIFSVVRVR